MGPVVVLGVLVKLSSWRDRRRGATGAVTRSRVVAGGHGERAVIAVSGPLDYPALLDIEVELGAARQQAVPAVVIDLRAVSAVDERSAADLPWIVDTAAPELHVTVLPARAEVQETLQRIGALDGLEVVSAESA
jgi:hypothetical protein